ncbi:MAG: PorP/SprF family type IX secretion system membrane protein [Bacteroidota bacterium]|nr:PorP/SprF family type IX secretion system membrane protein [Bacteroidota bacterium]
MRQKIFLFTLLTLTSFSVKAQIYTPYNLYSNNLFLFNPAHAGDKDHLAAFLIYRQHLTGLDGAPVSQLLGIHAPITQKMGIGGVLQSGQVGMLNTFSGRADYSFRTQLTKNQLIAFGINGGYFQRSLNQNDVYVFDSNDPILLTNDFNQSVFYGGAGIEYQLFGFSIDVSTPLIYSSGNTVYSRYLARAAYEFNTKSKTWQFTPEFSAVLTSESNLLYRASVITQYSDIFWVQTGYKQNTSLVFAAGIRAGKFGFSYAYDTNAGNLANIGGPSHEVSVSYGLFEKHKTDTIQLTQEEIEHEKMLRQKINGKSYEKYVQANNYGFYNDVLTLTDSMHQEKKKQQRRDSVIKAIAYQDSLDTVKTDSLKNTSPIEPDTVEYIKSAKELTKTEYKVLEQGVFFDIGSANINIKSQDYLNRVAKLLNKNHKIKLLITGYTCDIGSEAINEIYATDRAEAVKYYLINNEGIHPKRLVTETMGESDPVVPNTNEANRQKNRRVLFSIVQ